MPWGNLNLNLAVRHKDWNLIRKGGAGMEKERKKKAKRQGLSTCILQIQLCRSILIATSDRLQKFTFPNAFFGFLTGFYSSCLSREVNSPSCHIPTEKLWWIRMKEAQTQSSRWKRLVLAEILYMCVAVKPLTPLAAINTIATQHPS